MNNRDANADALGQALNRAGIDMRILLNRCAELEYTLARLRTILSELKECEVICCDPCPDCRARMGREQLPNGRPPF